MQKDTVLFVNAMYAHTYDSLEAYNRRTGRHLKPVVLVDAKLQTALHQANDQQHLYGSTPILSADFTSAAALRQALQPYRQRLFAVTSQYENSIHELKHLIPFLPYLPMPTETSLEWATDKKLMREAFDSYDQTLSPRHLKVHDASRITLDAAEATMTYPLIIKPSGLERSLLVSVVHDRKQLENTLAYTFQQLDSAYKRLLKRLEPAVILEEFMEGDMFSVDSYVDTSGNCVHAPVVKVVTGHKVGFDDFFAHLQTTANGLGPVETAAAERAAEQACRALGLRSITAHTEMMKTANGWKIIEVGPRIGGYRHELYAMSQGLDHIMNDILNRSGAAPVMPAIQPARQAAAYKTYARREGRLEAINGLDIIRQLPSYVAVKLPYQPGAMLRFARNNGDAPVEITLCHQDIRQLEADIHEVERVLRIQVAAEGSSKNYSPIRSSIARLTP